MRIVEIIRVEEHPIYGTFGVLRIDKAAYCVTLEPPDVFNAVGKSNIPPGQYICKRCQSPRFGDTFEIANVPGRTNVLIHPGNSVHDTAGCVIVAQHYGKLRTGDPAVLNSGDTHKSLLTDLGYKDFHLTIHEAL
ncbi:MAG: DUF5675 family protein [Pseudomonadota bacterium]